MVATDSATRRGSSVSSGPGLPVAIRQKSHRLVHWSPPIRNVASRSSQHSKILGHPASSQTVCSPSLRTSCLSSVYCGPVRSRVLIQGGLRSIGVWLLRASRRSMRRPSGASTTAPGYVRRAADATDARFAVETAPGGKWPRVTAVPPLTRLPEPSYAGTAARDRYPGDLLGGRAPGPPAGSRPRCRRAVLIHRRGAAGSNRRPRLPVDARPELNRGPREPCPEGFLGGRPVRRETACGLGSGGDGPPGAGAEQLVEQAAPLQAGPFDVTQPLGPGLPPRTGLDQVNRLCRAEAATVREGAGYAVAVVTVVARLAVAADPPGQLPDVGPDAVDPAVLAPAPLDEHQAPGRRCGPPCRQGGRRVGQGPDQVTLHDSIEVASGRAGRVRVHGADVEPEPRRLGLQARQHPGGQVQGGDLIALAGQQQGQEPGACPGVEYLRRGIGQQAPQRAAPCREFLGPLRVVRGRVVVAVRVLVPELPDFLRDAVGRHCRSPPPYVAIAPPAGGAFPAGQAGMHSLTRGRASAWRPRLAACCRHGAIHAGDGDVLAPSRAGPALPVTPVTWHGRESSRAGRSLAVASVRGWHAVVPPSGTAEDSSLTEAADGEH